MAWNRFVGVKEVGMEEWVGVTWRRGVEWGVRIKKEGKMERGEARREGEAWDRLVGVREVRRMERGMGRRVAEVGRGIGSELPGEEGGEGGIGSVGRQM